MANFCIFRSEKLKSHKDIANVLKEQHRAVDYDSKRADSSLSHLNSYSSDYDTAIQKYDNLLPAKIRKNAVVGLNFLVTTSQEFLSQEDEARYYEKARQFISKRFGDVVGWAIHRDEKSTHMQVVTIPLVNGKLNARALIGGDKHKMQSIQTDFWEEVGKPFGLGRGNENSPSHHKTVEQFHREKLSEIEQKQAELANHEKSLTERNNRLLTRSKSLDDKETLLNEKDANLTAREADIEPREKAVEDKSARFKRLDEISAGIREEVKSYDLSPRDVEIFPPLEKQKVIATPEAVGENFRHKFGEKSQDYAFRVVKHMYNWAVKRVQDFTQKYNHLQSVLYSTRYSLAKEKDATAKFQRDLEMYDYRKKSPDELEQIAQQKRLKQQKQSQNLHRDFGWRR